MKIAMIVMLSIFCVITFIGTIGEKEQQKQRSLAIAFAASVLSLAIFQIFA